MANNKTENRSRFIMITALVLMLVLLLSFGGYTLAKYVTSKNVSSGTASVATWGYTVSGDATKAFGSDYTKNAKANAEVVAAGTGVDVKADSADDKLIAPGTTGEITFSVTGKSEVLAKVAVTFTANKMPSITATANTDTVTYSPITFTLQTSTDGNTYTDVTGAVNVAPAAIQTAIATGLGDNATSIAAGTQVALYYKLIWNWNFENGDQTAGSKTISADVLDTAIAESAATYTDANDVEWTFSAIEKTFDFSLNVKVEQIQSK
jgi:hypothetical protein